MNDSVRNVLTSKVYDVAKKTPLDFAKKLSKSSGAKVYLKREDLQPVHSFKIRGAYNKMASLTKTEKDKGVIAASAGNHAQGVALSAKKLGISALIVMPATTPDIKVEAVKSYGANVELFGDNYSEASDHCKKLIESSGRTFVHPYDDPLVIAGQGTIGMEILEQLSDVDAVFVPVGGGGLIAGIGSYIKHVNPDIKIIGVEPSNADAMAKSLKAKKRVKLDDAGLFADGVAVKEVGVNTFEMAMKYVDEVVTVSTDELCAAIKDIFNDTRNIVEPAGALGVAGVKKYSETNDVKGKNLIAINSGANMNFERLQFVAERTLVGAGGEALYRITLTEEAGSLKKFCEKALGDRSITEFNYRLNKRSDAHIFVGIGVKDQSDRDGFEDALAKYGYDFEDLTGNELAKVHVRHMVGGPGTQTENEVLYSFVFPEKPEALKYFLEGMSKGWNISAFHYRGIGGDRARVLMGFEIPPQERPDFIKFLDKTGYAYVDETENSAYHDFLTSNRGSK